MSAASSSTDPCFNQIQIPGSIAAMPQPWAGQEPISKGGKRIQAPKSKLDSKDVTSESEVGLIPVSECVSVCVSEWLVCAAECCQPLPHSSPPEQIACHRTSITHTPSSDQGDTKMASPPHPRPGAAAGFLEARWHGCYTRNLFIFSVSVKTLPWNARLPRRGGHKSISALFWNQLCLVWDLARENGAKLFPKCG